MEDPNTRGIVLHNTELLHNFLLEKHTRRIVLLGKTGSGKSSLANTIFGEKDVFNVNHKSVSGAKTCESKTKTINSKIVQLIDTPGFLDTDPNSTELSPEILRCMTECAPGPHAFLFVLKVEKLMPQDDVLDKILKYFSEEALKYTTLVFTHGNQIEEGKRIEDWISDNEALRKLVDKCGGRCHVFDNKYWNNSQDQYRNNQVQVKELLETINNSVRENGGKYYTNEMLKSINDDVLKIIHSETLVCKCEVLRLADFMSNIGDEIKGENIMLNDIFQEAKQVVYRTLMHNMGGALAGVLVGAFLGAGVMVYISAKFSPGVLQCVAAAVTGAVVGGVVGGLVGAWASEKWSSPVEAVQDAASLLREVQPLVQLVNQIFQAGFVLLTVFR